MKFKLSLKEISMIFLAGAAYAFMLYQHYGLRSAVQMENARIAAMEVYMEKSSHGAFTPAQPNVEVLSEPMKPKPEVIPQ